MAINYQDSGVDVERGYKAVELIRKHVQSTYTGGVIGDIGGFGAFYSIEGEKSNHPVLVSGCDGVGTKLKYAFISGRHSTVGIDCVAMCVNDIVCHGARPLFFLDYFAAGRIEPDTVAEVVGGIARGCRECGAALIGGETAEMPSFYKNGEYDLAGFAVGIVDREKIIDGENIREGDILIGLYSSGAHSNGYSMIRKLFGETPEELSRFDAYFNRPAIDVLLEPTKIYVTSVLKLGSELKVKGCAHITGGGFIENIPRMFKNGLNAEIDVKKIDTPDLFKRIEDLSKAGKASLYNTFNMGIGMVVCVDKKDADKAVSVLTECGEKAVVLGKAVKSNTILLNF